MKTIFVSIASYRDSRCMQTVEHAFSQAKYPERVIIGICQQNKEGDPDCIPTKYKKNIRVIKISYKEAKGPTYARYMCSTMFNNEDFFLQIDSHNRFAHHWDETCIDMLESLEIHNHNNKKFVLSHYPPTYEDFNKSISKVTHITECFFNEDGILTFKGAVYKDPGSLPRRNAFVAGGFLFSRGQMVRDVPFDPHLPFLFTGEEILLSIRLFTHGYDVYTPSKNIVYHAYTRSNEPKFWDDHHLDSKDAVAKVRFLLGIEKDLNIIRNEIIRQSVDKYGLGKERSPHEFFKFIGVDIQSRTIGKPMIEFFTHHSSELNHSPQSYAYLTIAFLFYTLFFMIIYLEFVRTVP